MMLTKYPKVSALLFSLSFLQACQDPSPQRCEEAYQHLLQLADQRDKANLHQEFIEACLDHHDKRRLQCILESQSPEEALHCKTFKTRPD